MCEKTCDSTEDEPRTFGLPCQCSRPLSYQITKMDRHVLCIAYKLPMVQPDLAIAVSCGYTKVSAVKLSFPSR